MSNVIINLRKHWLALSAITVLVAIVLTAGTLVAANERQSLDIQPSGEQLPTSRQLAMEETDPGLTAEHLALVEQDTAGETEPGQVVPEPEVSDALAQWLAEQPEEMGFITQEDAITSDPDTMDWLLYQAVYKNVLTQVEADAVQDWYDRRPSVAEAPELLNHQPVYLYHPGDEDNTRELLRETESR